MSILHYQSNIDIWLACQGEKIFDTRIINWRNAILKQIDVKVTLPRYGDSCMVYGPKWYQKHKYRQILISYWYQKDMKSLS